MREMKAGEFKAKCLAVMDEVAATGEPVVITKRGKRLGLTLLTADRQILSWRGPVRLMDARA
jgi:PHD/YefM family antitoxin component YafN of YafNO toxin-antitoxin module